MGITTYNRAAVLPKAIASALAQRHSPLRVSVIDSGSVDDTPAVRRQFESISWERWEKNRGHVLPRNKMMLTADEDYYVSIDDDAWFMRGDEIATAVDLLQRNPKVAAVAFDIISPDRPHEVVRGAPRSAAMFIGCGHVLRLSAIRELGGYSEFSHSYGVEEKDLCLRLIDAGYETVQLEGVHVWRAP